MKKSSCLSPALTLLTIILSSTVPLAGMTFSGSVTTNVSWSGTVDLTGDVTINENGHLTIDPGTLVRCAALADDQNSGDDHSRVEIILDGGKLTVSGATSDPVRFTSSADPAQPGDWTGIRVVEGDLVLKNFVVEFAVDGLHFEDANTRFNSYEVANGTVQGCRDDGIWVEASGANVQPIKFSGLKLLQNQQDGLYLQGPVEIEGSQVRGNQRFGIYANWASLVVRSTEVTGNTGRSDSKGIYSYGGSLTVEQSEVSDNSEWGIWSYAPGGSAAVRSSLVASNGWGVYLTGDQTPTVVSNTVMGHPNEGVRLDLGGGWALSAEGFTGNRILGNGVGVRNTSGGDNKTLRLSGNDIYQNSQFEIRNDSSGVCIVAPGNYWGEPTTSELRQGRLNLTRIYDIRDDSNLKQALIGGWYGAEVTGGQGGQLEPYNYGNITAGVTRQAAGAIDGEQVWSGKVLVTGDVVITESGILRIVPGTMVVFNPLQDSQVDGADNSRSELRLQGGYLEVMGTAASPVVFTSAAAVRQPGDWVGIRVIEGDLVLKNFVVEFAVDGLHFEDANTRFNSYEVANGTVQGCRDNGIWVEASGANVQPIKFSALKLLQNQQDGLYLQGPVEIEGSQVRGNQRFGIYANWASLAVRSTEVTGNTGRSDSKGIYSYGGSLTVEQSEVSDNSEWGIWSYAPGGSTTVRSSLVASNGWGVYLTGDQTPTVVSNTVMGHPNEGVRLDLGGGWALSAEGFTGNRILGNGVGVRNTSGGDNKTLRLSGNDIYQNSQFEIRNDSSGVCIVAPGNYWGEPTTSELRQGRLNLTRIYDIRDDSNLKQALIGGWYGAEVTGGQGGQLEPYNYGNITAGVTRQAAGAIDGEQVWSGKVLVTGDIVITETGILRITPGTMVVFNPLQDSQVNGADNSRSELRLQGGRLEVAGTAASPVVFTSAAAVRQPGDWVGIRVVEGDLVLRNFVVEYAVDGLHFEDTDTRFNRYEVANGTVQGSRDDGIWVEASGANVQPIKFSGLKLLQNQQDGLYLQGPVEMEGGQVRGNQRFGIYANWASLVVRSTEVMGNTGRSDSKGIYSYGGSLTVEQSVVSENSEWGIWSYAPGGSTVVRSSLVANNGWGVYLTGDQTPTVVSNTVMGHPNEGVRLDLGGGWALSAEGFSGNRILGNEVGVRNTSGGNNTLRLNGNDIYDNSQFEIRNESANTIEANANYWGEPTLTELAQSKPNLSRIFDVKDNASYGQVLIQDSRAELLSALPRFFIQPKGLYAVSGRAADFLGAALGTEPILYQWYKDGVSIPRATNLLYRLSRVTASSAGDYALVAANSLGSATSVVARLILDTSAMPPSILLQPLSQTASEGTDVGFLVSAVGAAPLSYQWFKNGTAIEGAIDSALALPHIQMSDAGEYTVTVSNSIASIISSPAVLTVTPPGTPPSILQPPQNRIVMAGSSVTFAVLAAGTEPLNYQWQKNGLTLANATERSLTLSNVQVNDAGDYTVTIRNPVGTATSRPANLTVWESGVAPIISQSPQSQSVSVGQSVSLAVEALGLEPLSYQWRKNGVLIRGATGPTLTLHEAQPGDAGEYVVEVINPSGRVQSQAAALTVQGSVTGQPAKLTATQFIGAFIQGTVGATYLIEFTEDLNQQTGWTALQTLTLTQSPEVFVDLQSVNRPKRFYRAVLQP